MKVAVFTLGCKTNLYESQQIIAELQNNGYDAVCGLEKADVFVLNTCAITKEAERKSRQAVTRARRLNPSCKVIVVGCASQKNPSQFENLDNVTLIKGVANKEKIVSEIEKAGVAVDDVPSVYVHTVDAVQERTRAFVKIQDGCNNFCSYCIVPYLRGRSRSKPVCQVVKEVAKVNAQETVFIGIDISQYGKDDGESLPMLFSSLKGIPTRIRLGSLEQAVVDEPTLKALSELDFCPHFHLSLQSGCDATLRRMNRKYTTEEFRQTVALVRKYFPDVAVTTDVIVGFCGETDDEFNQTVQFVKEIGFADIHVFPYSPREGTVASRLPDVDAETKSARAEILGKVKLQLKADFIAKQIGKTVQVIAEQKKNGYYEGYTPNYVKVYFDGNVKCGDVVKIKLLHALFDGVEGELV